VIAAAIGAVVDAVIRRLVNREARPVGAVLPDTESPRVTSAAGPGAV
jgi:hypothetical protein